MLQLLLQNKGREKCHSEIILKGVGGGEDYGSFKQKLE